MRHADQHFHHDGHEHAPAFGLPRPRDEEWWFSAWEIEQKVWPLTRGEGVTVGLLDTGVEARLPDLQGAVLPGTGFGTTESRDGRRDVDTRLGGHGTAMAALIAGQGLGTGMVGIAPGAKVLPVARPSGGSGQLNKEIKYAVDHGAKVINMSFAMPLAYCPIGMQEEIAYAIKRDVVVVAGAGNEGRRDNAVNAPANCPGVLTVGGVTADLELWDRSTPGDTVMLAAPAVDVGSIGKDGTFSWKTSGTSQATALTSGVVALMRARYPEMSAREVVQRLLATAKDIGPPGWDRKTGYGAIIPYLALSSDVASKAPNPVYDRFDRLHQDGGDNEGRVTIGPSAGPQITDAASQQRDNSFLPYVATLVGLAISGAAFYLGARFRRRRKATGKSLR
nr:S8 family serine peptidase [Actinomadura sp. WMMB 499]